MTGTHSRDRVRKFMCASACARIQNSGWRPPIVNHLPTPLIESRDWKRAHTPLLNPCHGHMTGVTVW